MKLYLVTIGEYSDKQTVAVFDSLEKAQEIADLIGGDGSETFELNHFDHEEPPAGKKYFQLRMWEDGTSAGVREYSVLTESGTRKSCGHYISQNFRWILYANLYADSEEHAIKIVNEWRGQILAGVRPERSEETLCTY